MLRWTLGVMPCLLTLVSLTSPAAGAEANWIWGTPTAQQKAPSGECHFRKTFTIDAPQSALLDVTCDNVYSLLVNGRRVASDDNWNTIERYDITQLLTAGENTIELHCMNHDVSPAAAMARLRIQVKDQPAIEIVTDNTWQARVPPQGSWRPGTIFNQPWTKVHVIGPVGSTAPWNQLTTAQDVTTLVPAKSQPWTGPFELVEGDRVVLLGNTLIERAQLYGYWQTALTAAYPDRNITFRNLGWSGDTVSGIARARFGSVSEGFAHLEKHVRECEPTVIFVAYGGNEAFAGPAGLGPFIVGLENLLAVLEDTGAKIVLLSPLKQENLGPPLPDPTEYNEHVRLYRDTLRELAKKRGYKFVDFCELLDDKPRQSADASNSSVTPQPLTDNGLHLTSFGYWRSAEALQAGLELDALRWHVALDVASAHQDTRGTKLSEVKLSPTDVRFTALDVQLPRPLPPVDSSAGSETRSDLPILQVAGLAPGKYQLSIDDQKVATADASQWATGVAIAAGPQFDQVEKLRAEIVRKDELFFHRWRPQNETYLFLFRKHEQGNNAREIPQFDPLVAEAEAHIATLRTAVPHRYKLTRVEN